MKRGFISAKSIDTGQPAQADLSRYFFAVTMFCVSHDLSSSPTSLIKRILGILNILIPEFESCKITSFPALPSENLSYGEFAIARPLCCW